MLPPILDVILSLQFIIPALCIGYLFGSIPSGFLLTKAFGLGDIRNIGSGNIGATNALRTGNKVLAFLTLLCDMLKGTVPVIVVYSIFPDQLIFILYITALGALIGHIFPIWLKFKGGKGVATTIGLMLATSFYSGVLVCLTWLLVAFISKKSSFLINSTP